MRQSIRFATSAAIAALFVAASPAAFAEGKGTRAKEAIAGAQAKIDIAARQPAVGRVPELQAHAAEALATAREDLHRGDKDAAIADANHASEQADLAVGEAQRVQRMQAAAHDDQAQASAVVAANAAGAAQADAARANMRADNAEARAADAQAQAAAAASRPVQVIQAPTPPPPPMQPVSATVTTQTSSAGTTSAAAPVHHTVHHYRHRPVHHHTTTTTTTVTMQPPAHGN